MSAGAMSTGSAASGAGRFSSRASYIRAKRARRSIAAPMESSSPTMAGANSTARSPRSARFPPLSKRWAAARRAGTPAALPAIVEAIGGGAPVLIDGGFRRGIDVVKALALGARAVMIGRPHLWGVACAGEDGVFWVLELFRREIDRALALGGWDGVAKLDRSIFFDSQPGDEGSLGVPMASAR